MKGTLHKTTDIPGGWSVLFWENNPHFMGGPGEIRQIVSELEVSEISLTNPDLSTYWVDGREVLFVKTPLISVDGSEEALIMPDEETWDDIFKNICDQDLTNINDIWNWLKQNYEIPKRK